LPEGYVFNWTAVALAAIVGLLGMVAMFAAAYILSPRRPSRVKGTPYECGIPPAPHSWSQLHIRYYIFAILFLIFDVEAVFIFPWSVIFLGSKLAFYAMLIFLAVLFFAIIYGWRKGVLEWWK
jgi:NADH:ubiquinone oxidoreductase subunit 3 (subunit A)